MGEGKRLGGGEATSLREGFIVLLFVGVTVAYLLQTWFISRYGEPYPAITLPAFAGTRSDELGRVSIEGPMVRAVFVDGSVEDLASVRDLFAGLPAVYLMRVVLKPRPPSERSAEERGRLRALVTRVMPGYGRTLERKARWIGVDENTRRWLRRRLLALFPGRRPVLVTIVWHRDVFVVTDGSVHKERTETSRLDIEL